MQQVRMPQRQNSGNALTAVGAIAGGIAGGGNPGAIAQGAGYGSTAGSLLGQTSRTPAAVQPAGNAMSRRLSSMQDDRLLKEGQNALAQLPPDLRKEYEKPIMTAAMLEARQRGIA